MLQDHKCRSHTHYKPLRHNLNRALKRKSLTLARNKNTIMQEENQTKKCFPTRQKQNIFKIVMERPKLKILKDEKDVFLPKITQTSIFTLEPVKQIIRNVDSIIRTNYEELSRQKTQVKYLRQQFQIIKNSIQNSNYEIQKEFKKKIFLLGKNLKRNKVQQVEKILNFKQLLLEAQDNFFMDNEEPYKKIKPRVENLQKYLPSNLVQMGSKYPGLILQ